MRGNSYMTSVQYCICIKQGFKQTFQGHKYSKLLFFCPNCICPSFNTYNSSDVFSSLIFSSELDLMQTTHN